MKKGDIKLIFLIVSMLGFFVLNTIITVGAVPECSDGIDNDNDGNVDYLINLDENSQTRTIGIRNEKTDPFLLLNTVIINIKNKKFPYSLKSEYGTAIAHKLSSRVETDTLNKLCNIIGYKEIAGAECQSSVYNRCNFDSPEDNKLWRFNINVNDFNKVSANPKDSNNWLSKLICKNRYPACSDGWDNDGDGKIDFKTDSTGDNGCKSVKDDSEFPDDADCCSKDDFVEGPAPDCNNGCDDDDGDGLIDMNDNGCTDLDDFSEKPECSDGIDNDGDTLIDYPDDPGCFNEDDNSEHAPQCSNGKDDDKDGKTDFSAPESPEPSPPDPSPPNPTPTDPTLIASYSFDEPVDLNRKIYDKSGNNNHGTVSGTTQAEGKIGKAYDINDNDYITIDNEVPFDFEKTDPFSISMWLKPDMSDIKPQVLISKYDYSNSKGWYIFLNDFSDVNDDIFPGVITIGLQHYTSNRIAISTPRATKLRDGNWHHYVVTYDGSSRATGVKLYEDGISLTLSTTTDRLDRTHSILNNKKVIIGNKNKAEGRGITADNEEWRYNGLIDELKIWKKALTSAEVTTLYSGQTNNNEDVNDENNDINIDESIIYGDPGCENKDDDDETDPLITTLTEAFWGNTYSTKISETDIKDTVTLNIIGNNINGKNIIYEIFKDTNNDGNVDNDDIYYSTQKDSFNGEPPYWFAGYKNGPYTSGSYYFKAKILGINGESNPLKITSNFLIVSVTEKNEPPIVRIINPEDKQMYFKDENLELLISYDDPDDFLAIRINFAHWYEKGQSDPDIPYVINGGLSYLVKGKGTLKIPVKYIVPQQKNIEVLTNEVRGISSRAYTSILIVDSNKDDNYVLSYIDKPLYYESFNTNRVSISAESTYAIKGTMDLITGKLNLECIGGLCPEKTKGCPSESIGQTLDECRIPVNDFPQKPEDANYDPILFKWIFDQDDGGECTNKDICGVNFIKRLRKQGYKHLKLKGGLTINTQKTYFPLDDVTFSTYFDNPMCLAPSTGNEYADRVTVPGRYYWITKDSLINSINDCKKASGIDYQTLDDRGTCCPLGDECIKQADSEIYKCVPPTEEIKDDCEDFTQQDTCDDDNGHPLIAIDDLSAQEISPCGESAYGESCVKRISCKCEWKDNKCTASQEKKWYIDEDGDYKYDIGETEVQGSSIAQACSTSDGEDDDEIEHCVVTSRKIISDECNQRGYQRIEYNYGGENCPPRVVTSEIKCSNLARLGFFNWWNVFLVILVLFIIYSFYSLFKRKKRIKVNQRKVNRQKKK